MNNNREATTSYADAANRFMEAGGTSFAYRELGRRGGVPLVILNHWGAVLDNFDPRIMDGLAGTHHVIGIDYRGIGLSGGSAPVTIDEMAAATVSITEAEVARAKIRAHLHHQDLPTSKDAWELANYLKQGEDLRLLYVAMTRAKKLLWLSAEREAPFLWNRFNWQQSDKLQSSHPSPLFTALCQKFPQLIEK